jgi:hypothetical protein
MLWQRNTTDDTAVRAIELTWPLLTALRQHNRNQHNTDLSCAQPKRTQPAHNRNPHDTELTWLLLTALRYAQPNTTQPAHNRN